MSDLEVKSVASLAGSGVPYAYAVKAGPWIFLTGHEAFEFGAIHCRVGHADGKRVIECFHDARSRMP